jgi:hypothetical protein
VTVSDAYLDKHAEAEAHLALEMMAGTHFEHCVVIPAFDESATFLEQVFARVPSLANTLLIAVANAPENASDDEAARTGLLLKRLTEHQIERQTNDRISVGHCRLFAGATLLVVNLCEAHRPRKQQGVGRARKAGADIAYALWSNGLLRSRWMHMTDADAVLPSGYLEVEPTGGEVSCALYPFTHGEGALSYELRLRLYVEGLRRAGSPYAFHTLGSILKISLSHYADVRGFPKRAAGEDFYLLNKLAKNGFIENLEGDPVYLSDRVSRRVPFGTGPAVSVMTDDPMQYPAYDPRVFAMLEPLLAGLGVSWSQRAEIQEHGLLDWLAGHGLEPVLRRALDALKADEFFRKAASQSGSAPQMTRRFHTWFDAFKTMRTIHRIRESGYPDVPLRQAIAPWAVSEARLEETRVAGTPIAGTRIAEACLQLASQEPRGVGMGIGRH